MTSGGIATSRRRVVYAELIGHLVVVFSVHVVKYTTSCHFHLRKDGILKYIERNIEWHTKTTFVDNSAN